MEDFALKALLVSLLLCGIVIIVSLTISLTSFLLMPKMFCGYYVEKVSDLYNIYADVRFQEDPVVYTTQDRTEALFAYAWFVDKSKAQISPECFEYNSVLKFPRNMIINIRKILKDSKEARINRIKELAKHLKYLEEDKCQTKEP